MSRDGACSVSLTVTNSGAVAGGEVVQLYIAPPNVGRPTSPLKQLKGFTRVELAAGESKQVTIELEKEAFS